MLKFIKSHYNPSPDEFLMVNPKAWALELRLAERGAERGKNNLPSPASESMDEVEQDIITAIRGRAQSDMGRFHDQLSSYTERLKSADASGEAAMMRGFARTAEAKLDAEILAARGDLVQAEKNVSERKAALKAFRKENRLERPAAPEKNKLVLIAILLGLFLFETLPNAILLGEGNENGIAGGYVLAIMFSILSLGSGFGAGIFGLANFNHCRLWRRAGGALAALVLMLVAAGTNLLVAHYRAAVEGGMTTTSAARAVIETVFSDPFAVGDAISLVMIGIGALFAVIAMTEGYFWQDPYPGYAAVTRALKNADDEFSSVIEDKLDDLNEVEKIHVDEIRTARSSLKDRRQAIPRIIEERKKLLRKFASHIDHLQDSGRLMLATYRDANEIARTDPVPQRFNQVWALEGFTQVEVDDTAWLSSNEEFRDADAALEQSINRLQDAYTAAVTWIRDLNGNASVRLPETSDEGELELGKAA